jgi:hypothetical protein
MSPATLNTIKIWCVIKLYFNGAARVQNVQLLYVYASITHWYTYKIFRKTYQPEEM